MKCKKTTRNRSGFTLIEVVGACIILSIAVMGTMQYSVQSARIIQQQGNARAAFLRARQRMELIMAAPATAPFWGSLDINKSYYLSNYNTNNGLFTATTGQPTETIDVNTGRGTIWSKVTKVKTRKAKSAEKADFIEIDVSVRYGNGTNDVVSLKSSRAVYQ